MWLTGLEELPLLAYWRQGRGKVASLATSWRGKWAVEWDLWPQANEFRGALLRWLVAGGEQKNWEVWMEEIDSRLLGVSLRWVKADATPPAKPPQVALKTISGVSLEIDWQLVGPGHWEASLPPPEEPVFLEGMADNREEISATVWNPQHTPALQIEAELAAAPWKKPIFLRPWLLGLAVLWLALVSRQP
jgi:hypothetical protein